VGRPTVIFQGEDAGDAYYFWQWLDGADLEPRIRVVERDVLDPLLERLEDALPGRRPGEGDAAATQRMLTRGAFSTLERERELTSALGAALLPDQLVGEIIAAWRETGERVLLRTLPAPSCARVPWELLPIELDGKPARLLAVADVVSDPPVGVYSGRAKDPRDWSEVADAPPLYVVDPASTGEDAVLSVGQVRAFWSRRAPGGVGTGLVHSRFTRADLSTHLRTDPSRFMYVGHVASVDDQPGATSLLLSDPRTMYGVTPGTARVPRPFSALDAVQGTYDFEEREPALRALVGSELEWPQGKRVAEPGARIWPMPSRVALIACNSGSDLGHPEPFGLVIAFIHAGAGLLTATRWTLPTDRAFRDEEAFDAARHPQPLFDMALAVDAAHREPDAVGALSRWQRSRLADWEATTGAENDVVHSPVLWGALTTYLAPRRIPELLVPDESAPSGRSSGKSPR
jgi:hypothetical protein